MIGHEEFKKRCLEEMEKASHPPLVSRDTQDPRIVQVQVCQQFSEATCGYSCLSNFKLYPVGKQLDLDSQVSAYQQTLTMCKECGLDGQPFDELQRYQLDILLDSQSLKKENLTSLLFGCNILQSTDEGIMRLQQIRGRVMKGEVGWIMVGVLIHWILVRAELDSSHKLKLTILDSQNFPLSDILDERFQPILEIVRPKEESRFLQFLKDYKEVVELLDRFFFGEVDLRREKGIYEFNQIMSSFRLFKAEESEQRLHHWLETQHHPKTIQDDLLPYARFIPKPQLQEWHAKCQKKSQDPLICRLQMLQAELLKVCQ